MRITSDSWHLVEESCPSYLSMQNEGQCRVAYQTAANSVIAASVELDSENHFILEPGSEPIEFKDLAKRQVFVYARAMDDGVGELRISKKGS